MAEHSFFVLACLDGSVVTLQQEDGMAWLPVMSTQEDAEGLLRAQDTEGVEVAEVAPEVLFHGIGRLLPHIDVVGFVGDDPAVIPLTRKGLRGAWDMLRDFFDDDTGLKGRLLQIGSLEKMESQDPEMFLKESLGKVREMLGLREN